MRHSETDERDERRSGRLSPAETDAAAPPSRIARILAQAAVREILSRRKAEPALPEMTSNPGRPET